MIGPRLKSSRIAAGLSQTALAQLTGLSQSFIAQIEGGDRMPGLETVQTLAKALGVASAYLMGGATEGSSSAYGVDPLTDLLADYNTPPGLRTFAEDKTLVKALVVQPQEWSALRSLNVPSAPSKDGYIALLYIIRAVCPV